MAIDRVGRTVVTPGPAAVTGVSMHRPFTSLFRCLVALALLVPATLMTTLPAAAATIAPTTTCSNGVDDTPGLGLICQVTVVNTITATGGSATVTVHECHGAAGAPSAACTDTTTVLTEPVTAVTQCNNSINGGGGTLRCSVVVTNNFVDVSPGSTAATVNQCVGSGGGITTGCNPFPATTTSAAITQCNGSANGGTLVGLTCTATGTMDSAHAVTVNQCNDSANGGGALVICSASIANNAVAVTPTATPSAGAGASASAAASASASAAASAAASARASAGTRVTPSPTNTVSDGSNNNSTLPLLPLLLMGFAGTALAIFVAHRRIIRS
jgi:hypothetical protein